jgi:hypothetical protein
MITKQLIIVGCAAIVLSVGAANAGPCNTPGKDAGSGPTPGATGQTTGTSSAKTDEHPPTAAMNKAAVDKATSMGRRCTSTPARPALRASSPR